jgi:hypothetical protein
MGHPLNYLSLTQLLQEHITQPPNELMRSWYEATVGKADLPDYTAHELPLPLFDLGHDRACTSAERLCPFLGASMSSRVQMSKRLYLNSASAMASFEERTWKETQI